MYIVYLMYRKKQKQKIMKNASDYRVKGFNNNTLFAVISDSDIHSKYYKSEKAANKMLNKVRVWAGE